MDVTAKPEQFYKILVITVTFIAVVKIAWTEYCLFAFGIDQLQDPLITASLPQQLWITYAVKIMFSLNLVFSYPLIIHPTNMVIEDWIFSNWESGRKRQMCKNVSRTIIVGSTCVVALLVYNNLDKFLSITGSLFCAPVAFILPALFHYMGAATTMKEKVLDIIIMTGGIAIMFYCTIMAIINFNA